MPTTKTIDALVTASGAGPLRRLAERLADPAVGLLLASLTIFLAFSGGGFFPGATGIAAIVLCVALVLRITLADDPFAGLGTPRAIVPLGLLSAFAVWTLVSASWSDAPARALLEFDRALLYVLALAFFATLTPSVSRLAWGIRGFAAATVVICGSSLITRVAADLWPIAANVHDDRLSFPVTYWNVLGLLATLGIVACIHLTTSERESRVGRVLAAAAIPLLAATLLLTFSRASLVLAPVGFLVYAAVGRPRALLTGIAAVTPPLVLALVFTYRADLLSTARFDSPAAVAQGHDLALVLIVCVGLAATLRAALLGVDARLMARPARTVSRRTLATALGAALVALLIMGVALDAPSRVDRQWDRFVNGDVVDNDAGDTRSRLTSVGNNGRLDHWRVAVDAFEADPVAGRGAGTYQLLWARDRPYDFNVNDGHSLYLEVMGELGLVGILLLGGVLLSLLVGLVLRARGENRASYAAVLALLAVWAVHAGIDWDWEMPVGTLWLFALGGLALSGVGRVRAMRPVRAAGPPTMVRVVAALGVLVLLFTPAAAVISQSNLDDAVAAFRADDCPAAIDASLNSLDALKLRPEPYEVIGYCDARQGQDQLALQAMRNAVTRDPDNWETHYGLAIVQAAAGRDPRAQAAIARRLNPLEERTRTAVRLFRTDSPQKWKRRALKARLPID